MSEENSFVIYDPTSELPGSDQKDKKVIYESSEKEYSDIVESILLAGSFKKSFELMKGKLILTYTTIPDSKRRDGLDLMKDFGKANPDCTGSQIDHYTSKLNIALQLDRIQVGGPTGVINLAQETINQRMAFLDEQPEDIVRIASKYLIVFRQLINNAFNYSETLKN